MKKIAVINGPNLNMLGVREPGVYGLSTLGEIEGMIKARAEKLSVSAEFFQSNSEGGLAGIIHQCRGMADGIIINPGAYGHYSSVLADALEAAGVPCVEVHISNIHSRDGFRHTTVITGACIGLICGMGAEGYLMALDRLAAMPGKDG